LMHMSREEEPERRCKHDTITRATYLHKVVDPSTEECLDCIVETLAISIEDNKNADAMHHLHILVDLIKDLKNDTVVSS
jgi:hypothetical protein